MTDALREALPVAAVHSAIRWVEENIAPRRCDSDGVADCWRCTTVAMARWLDAALAAAPAPELDVERLARALRKFRQQWPIRQNDTKRIVEVDEAAFAAQIAAEYAALAHPEEERGGE